MYKRQNSKGAADLTLKLAATAQKRATLTDEELREVNGVSAEPLSGEELRGPVGNENEDGGDNNNDNADLDDNE